MVHQYGEKRFGNRPSKLAKVGSNNIGFRSTLTWYSYPAASIISQHFSEVFERPFNVAELPSGWPELFHSLKAQDIQRLFDKNSIGAFVSTQFYPELNTISEVAPYYIYVKRGIDIDLGLH